MTKRKDTLKMVYTAQEIQDILGLSRNGAYKLIRRNQFHIIKIGSHYRISKKSFDDWFAGRKGDVENGI